MKLRSASLIFILSVTCFATTVVPASIEHLTRESTNVVRARAMNSVSTWDGAHRRIYTLTRFQTLQAMKGSLGPTFVVKRLGGQAGGYTMKVAGIHPWQDGEETVLFLRPDIDRTFVVTALMQGDFRVHRNGATATVSNGVQGVKKIGTSGEVGEFRGARMTLDELSRRVRQAAAK